MDVGMGTVHQHGKPRVWQRMKGKEQSHDLDGFEAAGDNSKWQSRGCFHWDLHSVAGRAPEL